MADTITIIDKESRIRAILGVDEANLDNTVINFPEYYSAAEIWAKKKITSWQTLDSDKLNSFYSLIIYNTAQRLLPFCQSSIWNVQKEKTTHAEINYFASNAEIVAANIKDNLNELLAELLDDNSYVGIPFIGIDRSGRR